MVTYTSYNSLRFYSYFRNLVVLLMININRQMFKKNIINTHHLFVVTSKHQEQ